MTPIDEADRSLLTVNQVCGMLQLSRPVVYDLINTGQLRSFKVGRSRRIPAVALQNFISDRLAGSPDVPNWAAARVIIPADLEAEQHVVGLSVAEHRCATVARRLLDPSEFYVPALGRAFQAACQLDGVADQDRRLAAVAEVAVVDLRQLAAYVDDRVPSLERWARRVRSAACRRRLMAVAADLYNRAAVAPMGELTEFTDQLIEAVAMLSAVPIAATASLASYEGLTIGAFRRRASGA